MANHHHTITYLDGSPAQGQPPTAGGGDVVTMESSHTLASALYDIASTLERIACKETIINVPDLMEPQFHFPPIDLSEVEKSLHTISLQFDEICDFFGDEKQGDLEAKEAAARHHDMLSRMDLLISSVSSLKADNSPKKEDPALPLVLWVIAVILMLQVALCFTNILMK